MGVTLFDRSDAGVQLSLNGAGTGTYKDRGGVSHANGTLGGAYVAGPTFQLGRVEAAALSVHVAQGHATSITVKMEVMRSDPNNPGVFSWVLVPLARSDKSGVVTNETQILAADPVDIRLLTTDGFLSGDCRISAKAAGAGLDATDSIMVGVNVS